MLLNFESKAYTQRIASKSVEHPWSFTRKEGDVRCIGHIINLAVQDALSQLKAVPSDISETYRMDANEARIPVSQDEIVSALSKLRRHVYIFRNRRGFRSQLEQQLKATGMKQRLLVRHASTMELNLRHDQRCLYARESDNSCLCKSDY